MRMDQQGERRRGVANGTITVSLKLFGDLRKYAGRNTPDVLPVALPAGATVGELATQIGITPRDEMIAGVNGEQADSDTVLKDGDQVLLVNPMEGG
jgi:molybdopterin converting factor small subunit